MSRNYGISRDMGFAGQWVLDAKFHGGYQSKYDIGQRFRYFCKWAEERGVKKFEAVTFELVVAYGKQLQAELDAGIRRSSSSPKTYISAVNTVMRLATRGQWRRVYPGRDCLISPRCFIPTSSRAMPESKHASVTREVDERLAAIIGLQREFGLRFRESCLLDAKLAIREMKRDGAIVLRSGTKGGKVRSVPCGQRALEILERAASVQDGRSMVPSEMSYAEYRRECYRQAMTHGFGFHSERHHYAQELYVTLTGAPPPIVRGWTRKERISKLAEYLCITKAEAKEIDSKARMEIAQVLGHNREEISNAYIG